MPQLELPQLAVFQYRFHFSCAQPAGLPAYPGSAWRGAFGHALKRTVCVVRDTACSACLLKAGCAYSYIFETPPPANARKLRKYNAAPHPFVLQFDFRQTESNEYGFNLNLFGHGQKQLPFIIHAMQKAGEHGIGGRRQHFKLVRVEQIEHTGQVQTVFDGESLSFGQQDSLPVMPASQHHIKLHFHSPVRIKQQGKNMTPERFEFGTLFGSLLRRISLLTYFHSDTPLETDFSWLTRQAHQLMFTNKQLHWFDWKRYSSRQQTEMNMGGVMGSVELDLADYPEFWPYLWLGQWVHVGKATSMGLGHYSIEATNLSAS